MPFGDVMHCGIFGHLYLVGSVQTFQEYMMSVS